MAGAQLPLHGSITLGQLQHGIKLTCFYPFLSYVSTSLGTMYLCCKIQTLTTMAALGKHQVDGTLTPCSRKRANLEEGRALSGPPSKDASPLRSVKVTVRHQGPPHAVARGCPPQEYKQCVLLLRGGGRLCPDDRATPVHRIIKLLARLHRSLSPCFREWDLLDVGLTGVLQCVYTSKCATACVWRSGDSLQEFSPANMSALRVKPMPLGLVAGPSAN